MLQHPSSPRSFAYFAGAMFAACLATGALASAPNPDDSPATSGRASLPNQIVFQIAESAAESFSLAAGWSKSSATNPSSSSSAVFSSGVALLDQQLATLDPNALRPAFDVGTRTEEKRAAGLDRIFVLDYDSSLSPEEAAAQLVGPHVVFAEPNYVVRAQAVTPDDPSFEDQWMHHNPVFPFGWTEDADGDSDIAWEYGTGDSEMIIAILDTGVDATHPEFAGRMLTGFDYVNNDNDASDDEGHGTACAGIAAATGNNAEGIAGVIWDAKILPVKVLDENGDGLSSWVANGIEFAADNGAKVLSLSLGSESASSLISSAVNYAYNTRGALLFASTGNDNQSSIEWPAAFTNVMAVGSMSPCMERKNPTSCDGEGWWGSDYGTGIDFLAPGVLMKTTDIVGDDGYTVIDYYDNFNGTSSATPYAAGAAALVWSIYPDLTNFQLRDLLRQSAVDLGTAGYDLETGYGVVNPANAIEVARFQDATNSALGDTGSGRGVAFADFDGDGDADLYLTNSDGRNRLLQFDDGEFVNYGLALVEDNGVGYGAAFGDTDDDGDLDLHLANDGDNRFFENDGAGLFVDATVAPLDDPSPGRTTSFIDYDNDGDLDLYTSNDGQNKILVNDGTGTFTDVSAIPLGNTRPGEGHAWGDFDGDGDMDLFIANDGPNRLLRNDGGGVFANNTGSLLDNLTTHGAFWGDVNNDGAMDLFVANEGVENRLWINDGTGTFSDEATGNLASVSASYGVSMADFNQDGWIDILVSQDGASNQLFRNEEGVSFTPIANSGFLADSGDGRGVAFADPDCDGDMDFYVVNADGANIYVQNDQPGDRQWAQFRLLGDASNTQGIGARVRVVTGSLSQIREITAGSGYASQSEAVASFGLASFSMMDSVVVTWPSGTVDVATDVLAGSKIDIIEGEGVAVAVPGAELPSGDIALLGWNYPNPVFESTTIGFQAPTAGAVEISIFAIDGRRVRTLLDTEVSAGEHIAQWDRRDARGREVAAGVYFYRLKFDGRSEARTLVVR